MRFRIRSIIKNLKGGLLMNLELLRNLRREKKITQATMSEALGKKSKSGYCMMESGEVQIRADQLPTICDTIGMTDEQKLAVVFSKSPENTT